MITIAPSDDGNSPLLLRNSPAPVLKSDEVLIQIKAAALNHRDVYIRQGMYPAIGFDAPLLTDGCGVVLPGLSSPAPSSMGALKPGQRVLLNPGSGWVSDPTGPEGTYVVHGGTSASLLGTLQEVAAVPTDELEAAPEHLSDAEAAALPLAGLTAWRALVTKSGNALPGRNILVTGIGGGVALMALLFGVARGCTVFVTSSSLAKITRARDLGAAAGVNYADDNWPHALKKLLPPSRPFLDAVIDGAGGDIVDRLWRLLKPSGVVVSYGITSLEPPAVPMPAVMKNIELRGSTMGSRREFADMVAFVRRARVRPAVDRVVAGIDDLEGIDALFEDMKEGRQFGKLVVQIQAADKQQTGAKQSKI